MSAPFHLSATLVLRHVWLRLLLPITAPLQLRLTTFDKLIKITTVPFRNPVNIDDNRCRVMWKRAEVEPAPVKWAFSQRA